MKSLGQFITIGTSGEEYISTTASACTDDILLTANTTTTDQSTEYYGSVPINCSREIRQSLILEKTYFNDYEIFSRIESLREIREGWLKPSNHFKPVKSNSKINYNLPRSRLREKKQTFLLKAA